MGTSKEYMRAYRARMSEKQKQMYRERQKDYSRRWYEKLKSDSERYLAYIERQTYSYKKKEKGK